MASTPDDAPQPPPEPPHTTSLFDRPRLVATIYTKELLETFRDRKTLFLIIGIPLLFYPLLLLVTTELALSQAEKIKAQTAQVAVTGAALPAALADRIKADDTLNVIAPSGDPFEALRAGNVHAVVDLDPNLTATLDAGDTATVTLHHNSISPISSQAVDRLDGHLRDWRADLLTQRLDAKSLSPAYIKPVATAQKDIAPQARKLGSIAAQVLPMFLLVFMVTGAFYPAIDLTAGERERKTIQTLLTSPIRPLEIVTGKYLVVFTMAMLAGLVNLLSMGLILTQTLGQALQQKLNLDFAFSVPDIAAVVWVVFLFGIMLSAVLMTIASLAATPKDAQSYLSPVYLLCILPVAVAGLPGLTLTETTAFVPVMNLALVLKDIMVQGVVWQDLFLVTVSTLITTTVALALAARIYTRQDMLITDASLGRWITAPRGGAGRPAARVPSLDLTLALTGALFIGLFYIGSALQQWDLLGGLALTLYGLILLPSVAFARLTRADLKATFNLRRPPVLSMIGATLMGLSAFIWLSALVQGFHDTFLPMPESFLKAMEDAFQMPTTPGGKALVVLVMALSPALCEEALFRGVLLSSLRQRAGVWVSVAASALVFGLFHLSLYRLLGTATLGALMAVLVWRSGSIWPAVWFHFLNNAASLLSQDLPLFKQAREDDASTPWLLLIIAALLSITGLAAALKAPVWDPDTESNPNTTPPQPQ